MLVGDAIAEVDERGEPIRDDTLLILLNAGDAAVTFTLPPVPTARRGNSCSTPTAAALLPACRRHGADLRPGQPRRWPC